MSFAPDPKREAPMCIGGERGCPPEDVGGIHGYETFLGAIRDPKHPEHQSYIEWIGREFDPEAFDLVAVNKALRSLT
ncbi:MAG: plasmid pRiA4b ORF-3 family protein [Chloroflexi bacterium]|nr:plasmid pRiA4b ORF-3 family protein [Chloroflexota bacterium]